VDRIGRCVSNNRTAADEDVQLPPAAQSASMSIMRQFVDDDAGYLDWIATHPQGFVLNTYRRPTPAYLMLHHASCRMLRVRSNWTKDYRKVCGERGELEAFARQEVRGHTTTCSRCL
jgi:hypothetical protein